MAPREHNVDSDEHLVAQEKDLLPGQMKEVKVEVSGKEVTVLLIRNDMGEWMATGNKCTHYGFPLCKGILRGDTLTCPLHSASWDITTGDIEDAPALDRLTTYKGSTCSLHQNIFLKDAVSTVSVRNENVYLRLPKEIPPSKQLPELEAKDKKADSRTFVVVGGGAAGMTAVQSLREYGFQGKIVFLSSDSELPYDRTKLSKAPGVAVDSILLRPKEFFADAQIDVRLSKRGTVTKFDARSKKLTTASGDVVAFDKCLLCPGARSRQLPKTEAMANMVTIRSVADGDKLHKLLSDPKNKDILIIGSGFIGLELATSLVSKPAEGEAKSRRSVTVLGEETPLSRIVGAKVGRFVRKKLEDAGVNYVVSMAKGISELKDSRVEVTLDGGEKLTGDIVVAAIGAILNTEFLKSNLDLNKDGSINVNERMQILTQSEEEIPDVFAAGDVAKYPYGPLGQSIRIEHWNVAQQQARVAARNMVKGIPKNSGRSGSAKSLSVSGRRTSLMDLNDRQPSTKSGGSKGDSDTDADDAGSDVSPAPAGKSKGLGRLKRAFSSREPKVRTSSKRLEVKMSRFRSYKTTPFFWTAVGGVNIRFAGMSPNHSRAVIEGDLEGGKFAAYYLNDDLIVEAIATCGIDPKGVALWKSMTKLGRNVSLADLKLREEADELNGKQRYSVVFRRPTMFNGLVTSRVIVKPDYLSDRACLVVGEAIRRDLSALHRVMQPNIFDLERLSWKGLYFHQWFTEFFSPVLDSTLSSIETVFIPWAEGKSSNTFGSDALMHIDDVRVALSRLSTLVGSLVAHDSEVTASPASTGTNTSLHTMEDQVCGQIEDLSSALMSLLDNVESQHRQLRRSKEDEDVVVMLSEFLDKMDTHDARLVVPWMAAAMNEWDPKHSSQFFSPFAKYNRSQDVSLFNDHAAVLRSLEGELEPNSNSRPDCCTVL